MATINELNARNVTIASVEIPKLQAERVSYVQSRDAWQLDVVKLGACDFTLRSKREACIADKEMKKGKVALYNSMIAGVDTKIETLKSEIKSNLDSIDSINEQNRLLAVQGQDVESNLVRANAEAQAINVKAEADALIAMEKSASETKSVESDNKTRNIIITIVAIMLIVAILILVVRKLKKSKK